MYYNKIKASSFNADLFLELTDHGGSPVICVHLTSRIPQCCYLLTMTQHDL